MPTQVERHKLPSYQLGMEYGLEQGREQGQANIIRTLLAQLSAPEVAKLTGLDLQQIEQLAKQKR